MIQPSGMLREGYSCRTDTWRSGGNFDGIVARLVSISVAGHAGTGNFEPSSRAILSTFGDSADCSQERIQLRNPPSASSNASRCLHKILQEMDRGKSGSPWVQTLSHHSLEEAARDGGPIANLGRAFHARHHEQLHHRVAQGGCGVSELDAGRSWPGLPHICGYEIASCTQCTRIAPGSDLCNCLKKLVGERGFEPPTPWSRTRCSTRLSHSPTCRAPRCRRCFDCTLIFR